MVSSARIVQGEDAKKGSWPWQVAFYTKNGAFFCGGSIVSPTWVVSAAHCFDGEKKASDYFVIVGEHDRYPFQCRFDFSLSGT